MNPSTLISVALAGGLWSGALSAVTLTCASRARGDRALTGLNAPSHWFFGEDAVHVQGFSVRHTILGALTHQASAFLWSTLFAVSQARRGAEGQGSGHVLAEAVAVTAFAAWVDLAVVPKRLSPGFERRLSPPALVAVYGAFALGLAVAALRARRPRT